MNISTTTDTDIEDNNRGQTVMDNSSSPELQPNLSTICNADAVAKDQSTESSLNSSTFQSSPLELCTPSSSRCKLNEDSADRLYQVRQEAEMQINILNTPKTNILAKDRCEEGGLNPSSFQSNPLDLSTSSSLDKESTRRWQDVREQGGMPPSTLSTKDMDVWAKDVNTGSQLSKNMVTNLQIHHFRTPQSSSTADEVKLISPLANHSAAYSTSVQMGDQHGNSLERFLENNFEESRNVSAHKTTDASICMESGKYFRSEYSFAAPSEAYKSNIEIERPFKCGTCGKEYTRKMTLEEHNVSKHGSEPRYCCDVCSKGFFSKSALERHMNIHENNYEVTHPFNCRECTRRFTLRQNLEQHYMSEHGFEPTYRCDVCSKGFMIKYRYEKHLKVHEAHDEVTEE